MAVLETTSHGAWDCFLDLRGVGRVRFLPYPAGTREPLRVLKLHNWLAPVSPLNPKGGATCNLRRRPTKHAVGRRGPRPVPGHPCGHHVHIAEGDGVQVDAGQPSYSHTDTLTLSRTRSLTPPGLGRAARGEPWSTSCRPVTSNISRPRRFSCSHTGEICVNLPPNTLATS